MTEADITFIRKSYPRIKSNAPRLSSYFYNRMAELDPAFDELFQDDNTNHGAAFAELLDQAVDSLDHPRSLQPKIKKLEAQLKYYQIHPDCLNTIGAVFIDTLAFGFGNDFTSGTMNPWVNAYKEYAALFFVQ